MVTKRSGGDRATGFRDLFESYLLELGATVTRTPVVKTTSNIEGDETLTDGTPETIVVHFERHNQSWNFDKPGKIEGGDAFMLIKESQTMNVDDKITYEGESFRVHDVIDRYVSNEKNYKEVNLFLLA